MKTSDGTTGHCPKCGGKVSQDRKRRGFIRHLQRRPDGKKCDHGWTERD